jgi:copper homeostasis protein
LKLELVVYNIESALKAQEAGADRIELCADPGDGGTTPSYGTIEVVRQNVSLDLYVMIRPRGGDFLYSNYEFHAMKRDLIQCQRLSVDGVVFGILDQDGKIDKKRCRELIERARPLKVTCHRAFDRTTDPIQALEDCIEVGFDRILTSGQEPTAKDGIHLIKKLVDKAKSRITIMAGAGITAENASFIVSESGVQELHFSAATYRETAMKDFNRRVSGMGSDSRHEFEVRTVDPEIVRRIRSIEIKNIG